MHFKAKIPLFLTLLILICSSWQNLPAQRLDKRLQKKQQQDFRSPLKSAFDKSKSTDKSKSDLLPQTEFLQQPLEAAIDPESYIVGPGDVFQIVIISSEELVFKVQVISDGKLVIPTVAVLDVDGKTLSEVQTLVKEAAADKYLNSEITANLAILRQFRVHVTGQVMKPGSYGALAVDRVSNLIEIAEGITNWGSESAIEVRHLDGTVDMVDLYRYSKLGDLDANLTLKGGDVIYVPHISLSKATVRVEGPVNDPGVYQLAKNETVQSFLLRVDAYNRHADLTNAYLQRQTVSNGVSETIPIFPYLENQGNGHAELYLQDGDVIMVPQRNEEVYVIGAVRSAGPYAYYPNLTAIDYIGFAGSTERAVKPSKVQLIRNNSEKPLKAKGLIIEPGDTVYVPQKSTFGLRDITTLIVTVTNVLLTMKALNFL
ncbi:SLBB domain-containing protein [candidate division KSB1 bacterium]|nr:SLBB domain-containing protein [candidate division KSB1 bacterium]